MSFWKIETIDSWADFEKNIEALNSNDWIFRGQRSSSWDIGTSFYRELNALPTINQATALSYEMSIVREFSQSYKLYDSNYTFTEVPDTSHKHYHEKFTKNHFEKLSVLQHYGAPTRLTDWTFSPYVGLFFGLDGAVGDFSLFALNREKIYTIAEKKLGPNYYQFKDNLFQNSNAEFVYEYIPEIVTERIRIQQGLFLVPSIFNKTLDEILESNYAVKNGYNEAKELVGIKFILKKEDIQTYWNKLRKMNITHETVYPGFEGFCKSLKLNIISPR